MDMSIDGRSSGNPGHGGGALELPPGTLLGERYQIEERLGATPYGDAYRARDVADGRIVSIKVLSPPLIADPKLRSRLARELQRAGALEHKNVAQTIGIFETRHAGDAVVYVVTEFVDGQSLREMLDKKQAAGKPFSLKGAYNVIAHLCNALQHAHATTVHGALGPESVQVSSAGRVKICDFGLALALGAPDGAPQLRGTFQKVQPPEGRLAPEPSDSRADLYGVGVILYELLTGRTPPEGGQAIQAPSHLVQGLTASVDPVVLRCLAPRRDDRYADPQAVKEALHAAVAHELAAPGARTPPVGVAALPATPAARPPSAPPAAAAPASRPPAAQPARHAPQAAAPAGAPSAAANGRGAAARHAPPQVARAPIAASFNMDSALSAIDDSTERWLIQKDKLDFGPFNLRDVKAQIEGGKILGEHIIVDTESGERRRVKDHPQLRDQVIAAEREHAEKQREATEADERRRHKGKVVSLLMAMLVVIVGVLGGGGYYGKTHHWFEQKVVKEVVHDNDLDFLKGIEISLKVDPPSPKKHTTRRPKKGGKPGEFEEVTNLGDASEGGGDETLDQAVVQRVMTQNFKVLVGCIGEERRRNPSLHTVEMDFIIRGTGNVSAVKVNGQTGTPVSNCMYGKMQAVAFPKFNGQKTHASFTLALK
jgi:serine/threonine-protein kinase